MQKLELLCEDGNVDFSKENRGRERKKSGDVEQAEGEQARSERIGLEQAKWRGKRKV
jgi:hypothetical protein